MSSDNDTHSRREALLNLRVKTISGLSQHEIEGIYCVITVDKIALRTTTYSSKDLRSPEWLEGFTFDIASDHSIITVSVWAKASPESLQKTCIGTCELPLRHIKFGPSERWVKLVTNEPRPKAIEIDLALTYFVGEKKSVGVEDFEVLKLIGKGAFAKVLLVKKIDSGRLYAMKVLQKDVVISMQAAALTLTERKLLKQFNHPFVVGLRYSFQTQTHLYMVLDYVGGGELFYHMIEHGVFPEDTTRLYAAQVVSALAFLHEHNVVYRDLKPENLLLDLQGNVCLCDFGLSKEFTAGETHTFTLCGSREYMAPEIILQTGYGKAVDWWALGVLIYEMLTGETPFYTDDPNEMANRILNEPIQIPSHMSRNASNLVSSLLKRDAKRRLGGDEKDAESVKAHPFFETIDWTKLMKKELPPPFIPHLNGPTDVSYFDPQCTIFGSDDIFLETYEEYNNSKPTEFEEIKVTVDGEATTPDSELFKGFSYVSPSLIMTIARRGSAGSLSLANISSSPASSISPLSSSISPREFLASLSLSPRDRLASPRELLASLSPRERLARGSLQGRASHSNSSGDSSPIGALSPNRLVLSPPIPGSFAAKMAAHGIQNFSLKDTPPSKN